MRRILLKISYIGTNYVGWQKQNKGKSIQGEIIDAIFNLTNEKVNLVGSGRTDAGVHAICQMAHFDTDAKIPTKNFPQAINKYLPNDIIILDAKEVDNDFNARFSAKQKTYLYNLYTDKTKNIFLEPYAVQIKDNLNIDRMNSIAKLLTGTHNFKAFCKLDTDINDYTRTIYKIDIQQDENYLKVFVTGNGFLHNMVRIIVSLLVSIGKGEICEEKIKFMLNNGVKDFAVKTFPAKGLFLYDVNYKN